MDSFTLSSIHQPSHTTYARQFHLGQVGLPSVSVLSISKESRVISSEPTLNPGLSPDFPAPLALSGTEVSAAVPVIPGSIPASDSEKNFTCELTNLFQARGDNDIAGITISGNCISWPWVASTFAVLLLLCCTCCCYRQRRIAAAKKTNVLAGRHQQNEIGMTNPSPAINDDPRVLESQSNLSSTSGAHDNLEVMSEDVTRFYERPQSLRPPLPSATPPSMSQGRRIGTDEVGIEMTQMQGIVRVAADGSSLDTMTVSTILPTFPQQITPSDLVWDPFHMFSDQAHESYTAPMNGSDAMYNLFKAAADQATPFEPYDMPTLAHRQQDSQYNQATDDLELPLSTCSVFGDSNWAQFSESSDFAQMPIPLCPSSFANQVPMQDVEIGVQGAATCVQIPAPHEKCDGVGANTSVELGAMPETAGDNPFLTPRNPFDMSRADFCA